MRRLFRLRPSPAMVVAMFALLVALAGTSVAAVSIVIPAASVGSLQLKANSVNSTKVLNGSLLKADFKAGQIPAGAQGPAGPAGPAGAAGPAGPSGQPGVAAAGYVAEVKTAANTSPQTITSTSYTNVNNATTTVNVPTGETGRIIAWFSAEDACYGADTANQRCLVRITVDGTELDPAANTDAFWDHNGYADTAGGAHVKHQNDSVQSREIVRSSQTLQPGSHTVVVQAMVTNSALNFVLDDASLVVERVKL